MKPPTQHPAIAVAKTWLQRFEHFVRQQDSGGAKSLCHERLSCFGLATNFAHDVKATQREEWREQWPFLRGLTFVLEKADIVPSGLMLVIMTPWTCENPIVGGPAKQGRATIVLMAFKGGKLLAIHMHLSPNPVV